MPKATTRLLESGRRAGTDTDARQGEYTTYAPKGETCPDCEKPIKTLESCRRVERARASGGPVVCYRHVECPS